MRVARSEEVVGEIREERELIKCAYGVVRSFPSFVNKCCLRKKTFPALRFRPAWQCRDRTPRTLAAAT